MEFKVEFNEICGKKCFVILAPGEENQVEEVQVWWTLIFCPIVQRAISPLSVFSCVKSLNQIPCYVFCGWLWEPSLKQALVDIKDIYPELNKRYSSSHR